MCACDHWDLIGCLSNHWRTWGMIIMWYSNSSCRKVMILHLSVSHCVHRGEGVCQHAFGQGVYLSMQWAGLWVCPGWCLPGGVYLRGVSTLGGVYQVGVYPGWCLPSGCLLKSGVSAQRVSLPRWCLSRGVPTQGVCLLRGCVCPGVCLPTGCICLEGCLPRGWGCLSRGMYTHRPKDRPLLQGWPLKRAVCILLECILVWCWQWFFPMWTYARRARIGYYCRLWLRW